MCLHSRIHINLCWNFFLFKNCKTKLSDYSNKIMQWNHRGSQQRLSSKDVIKNIVEKVSQSPMISRFNPISEW